MVTEGARTVRDSLARPDCDDPRVSWDEWELALWIRAFYVTSSFNPALRGHSVEPANWQIEQYVEFVLERRSPRMKKAPQ